MEFRGQEQFFDKSELIVSKTDKGGRITYANKTFLEIAGYTESEVIGKPHNMIRHANMPRAIFDLLWKTVAQGNELFAYVVNSTKHDNYYWVIAHVTPSFSNGEVVGYHSTRRVPNKSVVQNTIIPLYDRLNKIEQAASSKKEGINKSMNAVLSMLSERGQSYNEFIAGLLREKAHV